MNSPLNRGSTHSHSREQPFDEYASVFSKPNISTQVRNAQTASIYTECNRSQFKQANLSLDKIEIELSDSKFKVDEIASSLSAYAALIANVTNQIQPASYGSHANSLPQFLGRV